MKQILNASNQPKLKKLYGRHFILPLVLTLSACAQNTPSTPQPEPKVEAPASPGINAAYKDEALDVKMWAKRFSGESREVYSARYKVLEALNLQPGDHIADIGAGTGLYIQLFANEVGAEGKVYAVDIAQKFLDFIAENAAADGLTNVETVLGEDRTSNLPSQNLDVVFHSDVYHHFEFPSDMNTDLLRNLKSGGVMFVLDFERIPGVSSEQRLKHVRAPKETVIAEIKASGFVFVEEVDLPELNENYLLKFRKE